MKKKKRDASEATQEFHHFPRDWLFPDDDVFLLAIMPRGQEKKSLSRGKKSMTLLKNRPSDIRIYSPEFYYIQPQPSTPHGVDLHFAPNVEWYQGYEKKKKFMIQLGKK